MFRRIQVLDLLGIETYLDVVDLRAGEKWEDSIRGAIDQTKFMILFWSKAARKSQWVEKEWRYALDRRGINYIRPLSLCLLNEAPPPSELAELHFGSPRFALHQEFDGIDQCLTMRCSEPGHRAAVAIHASPRAGSLSLGR